MKYELVSNRKESEKLAAEEFYLSTLEGALCRATESLKASGKEVSVENYDRYVRRQVSNYIISNEFDAGRLNPSGKPVKKQTKKALIAQLAKDLDLSVLAISWAYNAVFEDLNLNDENVEDRKQFGLVKIENMLADLEYQMEGLTLMPDAYAKLAAQYKSLMELYLKVGGAMPKNETNNKFVLGNDNSTTIKSEKAQIQQNHQNDMAALAPLLQRFLNK